MNAHKIDVLHAVGIELLHLLHDLAHHVGVVPEVWVFLQVLDSLDEQKQVKVVNLEISRCFSSLKRNCYAWVAKAGWVSIHPIDL